MRIGVNLQLGDDLKRLLGQLSDDKMREVAAAAVNEAALHGQALIVESTPVRTARLRNSIEVELATPDYPQARIHTHVEYALAVEFGTGVHSEAPDAPRQPITIRAKNPRTITYTRNGKTITRTIVALTWYGQIYGEPKGSKGWTSRKEVTIQGQKPAAMFRKNMPAIEQRLREALQRRAEAALRGT